MACRYFPWIFLHCRISQKVLKKTFSVSLLNGYCAPSKNVGMSQDFDSWPNDVHIHWDEMHQNISFQEILLNEEPQSDWSASCFSLTQWGYIVGLQFSCWTLEGFSVGLGRIYGGVFMCRSCGWVNPGCDGTSTDREKHLAQSSVADLCTFRLAHEKTPYLLHESLGSFWKTRS